MRLLPLGLEAALDIKASTLGDDVAARIERLRTQAWRQVSAWMGAAGVWSPQPTDRHAEILGALLRPTGAQANLVPDAHLAALAIEHGLLLCSADGDFARFPDLRWENPLSG